LPRNHDMVSTFRMLHSYMACPCCIACCCLQHCAWLLQHIGGWPGWPANHQHRLLSWADVINKILMLHTTSEHYITDCKLVRCFHQFRVSERRGGQNTMEEAHKQLSYAVDSGVNFIVSIAWHSIIIHAVADEYRTSNFLQGTCAIASWPLDDPGQDLLPARCTRQPGHHPAPPACRTLQRCTP
jgi:hypothetical protein